MLGAAHAERHNTVNNAAKATRRQENKGKTWGSLLVGLDDRSLVECYLSAIEMNLDQDFIDLLRKEIFNRKIDLYARIIEDNVVQKV